MIRSRPPNVPVGSKYSRGLFNREMGPLQKHLCHGEYSLLKIAPMLESEFLQISRRGEVIDVHNQMQTVIVGIACTNPNLSAPNVLLLARPVFLSEESLARKKAPRRIRTPIKTYELTRLLPLQFVKISVHNFQRQQLRFKLASGRTFYLQLCPQPSAQEDVFGLWVKVINMLWPLSDTEIKAQCAVEEPKIHVVPPPQKPLSPPVSMNLEETVSIQSVYQPTEPIIFKAEDVRSVALSMESPASSPVPNLATSEGKPSDVDVYPLSEGVISAESFESPKSPGDETDSPASSPVSQRKVSKSRRARRSVRRRSASRGRKPSKIISLIQSCSWGSRRRSKSREPKIRGKGKKR